MPRTFVYSEPWYCSACGIFVYNLKFEDGEWYPCEGAPTSRFLSTTYPKVCNVCWEAHLVLQTSSYWVSLDTEERERLSKLKAKNKLGGNY